MQLFLTSNQLYLDVTEFVRVTFDGNELRTYLNDSLTDFQPAKIGECFYVQPHGSKKSPDVTKAKMPETRGRKIAWALSFVGDEKQADSLEEFWSKFNSGNLSDINGILVKYDDYAFVLQEEPGKENLKPLLAFVSDTISRSELEKMLFDYQVARKLYCPEEFIYLL